jgi:hypothetical protein
MSRSEWRKHQVFPTMTLAGIPVAREHVAWLAAQLGDHPAGDRLRRALDNEIRISHSRSTIGSNPPCARGVPRRADRAAGDAAAGARRAAS